MEARHMTFGETSRISPSHCRPVRVWRPADTGESVSIRVSIRTASSKHLWQRGTSSRWHVSGSCHFSLPSAISCLQSLQFIGFCLFCGLVSIGLLRVRHRELCVLRMPSRTVQGDHRKHSILAMRHESTLYGGQLGVLHNQRISRCLCSDPC